MNKQSILRYNMSRELLPFHHFTEFAKFEIANRYECLVNGESEPCVYYCNSIKEYHREATEQDIWDCYVRLNVPKRLYGRWKCDSLFNKTTDYEQNFYCKSNMGVDLTLKEACELYNYNDARKLDCYMGKEFPSIFPGAVPYDHEFCQLETKFYKRTSQELFDCYKNKANLTMEKKYCDEMLPYGSLTKELNETQWLKVFKNRYSCYKRLMNISIDREYCDQTTKTEEEFYQCLILHKVNDKADYCIYSTKDALTEFGGPPDYRSCLKEFGIAADAAECTYVLKQHQRDVYFNKTQLNKTLISQCLTNHGMDSEMIDCELDADPFHEFVYWLDFKNVTYIRSGPDS